VENCHFWPFGVHYKPDDPYCEWINTYGVAFEFARTDWQYVLNTFCFGYGVGYKFSESEAGCCNGNFLGIGADCCSRAVLVEQASEAGLLITNGEFVGRWGSTDSVGLDIAEDVRGKVSLSNCTFFGPLDRCIWQKAQSSQLSVNACHFVNWDMMASGVGAVHLDSGSAIVQGSTFTAGKLPVFIGEQVGSAIIIGNQAPSGLRVENHAGRRSQILGNEENQVVWTEEAKAHYRVDVGAEGDDWYLRFWHDREPHVDWGVPDKSMRWSGPNSEFVLPVLPGVPYMVLIDMTAPEHAKEEHLGLYWGDSPLMSFPVGENVTVEGTLPGVDVETVTLRIRCQLWIPHERNPESRDMRTLGVAVRSITLRAEEAGEQLFDANRGEWAE